MAGVVADRVIVELEAKLDRYNANVRAAEARFNSAARNIERSANQVERSISRSTGAIGNQLRTLAATFATAFSVQQIAQYADGYTRFTNQLKVAGVEGERLGRVQNDLFMVAQRYGVELEGMGGLFGKLTQAQKELGASNAELMQFTTGVAAALKIQGGAASESRGALIQLTQALGGEIVRAEEFNSINEGARPILQAVANGIDRFGGSVAKLRREVVDGKVTSEEFFRGFLKGSADLEAQATKANLTIGASFTILNNALGKYIGETDASLSATQRISQAIISLSENLDTIVKALGIIAVILGSRYLAAALAAARTTGVVSTALFAMQARAVGAATAMEGLALVGATAGRTLLAAFGGPVGLAIAALATGIYYLATATDDAYEASAAYQRLEAQGVDVRKKAGDAADALAGATGRARTAAIANAEAVRQETIQYVAQARAALVAARAKAQAAGIEVRQSIAGGSRPGAPNPIAVLQYLTGTGAVGRAAQANADVKKAEQAVRDANAALKQLDAAIAAPPTVRTPSPGKDKKTKTPKAKKGPDLDEIARRFTDDMARGALEYQAAMAEVQGTVEARISEEKRRIRVEAEITARAIRADKDLSESQKAELLQLNEQIAQAKVDAVNAAERRALAQDAVDLAAGDIENKRALLEAQSNLANTTKERRDIELKLLDLQYEEQRIRLEAIVANETLRDAEREAARRALAALNERYGVERAGVEKQHQGPGAAYLDQLNAADLNEQLEAVQVQGLKGLEDQLTTTIAKVFELGGAFGQIANQIIADLIRIAVQKAIIGPLANMLFGGGSGLGGLLGGIFGGGGSVTATGAGGMSFIGPREASGGHVVAGKMYRVNEAGVEGFQPAQSGKIIPLGRMNRGDAGGTVIVQSFTLDARYGITTPELLRHVERVATSRAAQGAKGAFDASKKTLPSSIGKMQKLGTP